MRKRFTKLADLRRYPALAAGIAVIGIFVCVSIYTLIAMPYNEAIRLWRGGVGVWDDNPQNAAPVWFDLFTRDRLPRTIIVSSTDSGTKTEEQIGDGAKLLQIMLPFQYPYDGFPDELKLFIQATYEGGPPAATLSWRTPDGRTIVLQENRLIKRSDVYYISQDQDLRARLSAMSPQVGLFVDSANQEKSLKGDYELLLTAEVPQGCELNAKLVVYGRIHGVAGTDNRRRDLMVALLWGAPIALIFGVAAAVGTALATFVLSATGTWLGGKVDTAFQWLTQVNLIIPLLPVLIMVGYLYDRSIWTMLGLVIALNIFGASMLTNRAMFLQAKESPYIEAAQAYGAGNSRIIFRYLMPRIAPTLLPQFVLVVPSFVFLEATLAVLGLGDPLLPTWGKVLDGAVADGALLKGYYYWFLEPALLLMLLGIGFSLIGYSLDRIFNPRLRTV
ncbi:MAG: ABC transporter permease [Dehalococcoidia bacterium]|nr:ABC transporter permease [Dehalococcoidia bacterium]